MIKEQSSELGVCTLYKHAESHSFLHVLPVTISISRQEMLGEEVTAVPLHFRPYFQTLCSQAGFFFSLKYNFSMRTAVITVHGSRGVLESAQRRCLPHRWKRFLLPAPSWCLLPTATPAVSSGVVTSTVTEAVASTADPAVIRYLAFVQSTVLIKIKGLFHCSGSPSNYAPAISCGSLQVFQAALC